MKHLGAGRFLSRDVMENTSLKRGDLIRVASRGDTNSTSLSEFTPAVSAAMRVLAGSVASAEECRSFAPHIAPGALLKQDDSGFLQDIWW